MANLKFPPNDVKEMVADAKAHPGQVTLGSSGTNGNLHVAIEMLKAATSADFVHVPYRGTGPSLNDVVAGTISGAFTTTVSAEGLIKSEKVKVLGVAGPKRMDVIPNVPTFREQGIANSNSEVRFKSSRRQRRHETSWTSSIARSTGRSNCPIPANGSSSGDLRSAAVRPMRFKR